MSCIPSIYLALWKGEGEEGGGRGVGRDELTNDLVLLKI